MARSRDRASGDATGAGDAGSYRTGPAHLVGTRPLMLAEIVDGRALARAVVDDVKAGMAALDRVPGLAVILAGDDPASHVYVNGKVKLAREIGFNAEVVLLPANTSEERVLA